MGWRRLRRGQSEIIGALIVFLIFFVIIMPLFLRTYIDTQRQVEASRQLYNFEDMRLKERIAIRGTTVEEVGPGLWPAVWINNTGTIQVTLRMLLLVDAGNGSVVLAIDMENARPSTSPFIRDMLLNPSQALLPGDPLPDPGEPFTLHPGDRLLISFNLPGWLDPEKLRVLVETATGVIHPLTGDGGDSLLVPRSRQAVEVLEPWRGAFSPFAGFKLEGGDELLRVGEVYVERPSLVVYSDLNDRNDPYVITEYSFIYDDDKYPGLYRLEMYVDAPWWEREYITPSGCYAVSGQTVEIRGFLGTYYVYDAGGEQRTYFFGYAMEVWIDGTLCARGSLVQVDPSLSTGVTDFDGNGVSEATFYSYLNGPNYTPRDVDADDDGYYEDAVVWTYTVRRDISGMDFIRITGKVNYYWTSSYKGQYYIYRDLRIMSVAVWEYDQATDTWVLRHYRDFPYSEVKPRQFQFTVVFPLDRGKTYRVGLLFYDSYYANYNDDTGDDGHMDFTFALEYLVVEYGRNNPLFSTTPPVYIVAIPDPSKISGVGEDEYATLHGLSILEARVRAQAELLDMVRQELEFTGLIDYTVVNSTDMLCTLLAGGGSTPTAPPENAVIYWLQGSSSITTVSDGCIDDDTLRQLIRGYGWVFVQATGYPLWGRLSDYTGNQAYIDPDPVHANLTSAGEAARTLYKAFLIPATVTFNHTVYVQDAACLAWNATFYYNASLDAYGEVGVWVDCTPSTGVIIVNPVYPDWLGDGGVRPESLVQIAVYSGLQGFRHVSG